MPGTAPGTYWEAERAALERTTWVWFEYRATPGFLLFAFGGGMV